MNYLFKKILIISIFVFIFLMGIFYFFKITQNKSLDNPGNLLSEKSIFNDAVTSKDINLETKKTHVAYEKMSEEMTIKVKSLFKAQNINELEEEEKYYKERDIDIFGLTPIEEQINMLKKATNCQLDDELKSKFIKKEFKLFYGKGGPVNIDLLRNNNLKKCALRLIGSDGLDVSLDNFSYILAFVDGESIYSMQKSFYKMGVFDFVDLKLKEIGYEYAESVVSCDSQCKKKETEFFDYLSENILNDQIVKKVSKIYDEIFLTL